MISFRLDSLDLSLICSIGAIAGGGLIIAVSFVANLHRYGIGFAFILGGIGYLWFRKIPSKNQSDFWEKSFNLHKRKVILISNLLFLALVFTSTLIYYLISQDRTPLYFGLITLAYTVLILEIFFINNSKSLIIFSLFKTLVLTLIFRATRFYHFATIPGSDTHHHLLYSNEIVAHGEIPSLVVWDTKYFYTPLLHILNSMGDIICSLENPALLFLFVILPFTIITSLFIYLLGKNLYDFRVGLFSVVFVSIADMFILRGVTNITPSSLIICYFLVMFYCLTKKIKEKQILFIGLIVLLVFASVLTHQLSWFMVITIFIFFYVGERTYGFLKSKIRGGAFSPLESLINLPLLLYSVGFTIIYWGIMGPDYEKSFFGAMVHRGSGLIQRLFFQEGIGRAFTGTFDAMDFWSNLLYDLGQSLLIMFGLFGILMWISNKYRSSKKFVYSVTAFGIFLILYPGTFLGLRLVFIPHRLLVFLQIFLILSSAFAVGMFIHKNPSLKHYFLLIIIISLLIFFMITAPYINRGNSFYSDELESRNEYTNSEIIAVNSVQNMTKNDIYKDPNLAPYRMRSISPEINTTRFENYPEELNFSDDKLILVRSYYLNQEVVYIRGTYGAGIEPRYPDEIKKEIQTRNRIYCNGNNKIYSGS